jgi:peptide/nickel transport system substrate-binding protein
VLAVVVILSATATVLSGCARDIALDPAGEPQGSPQPAWLRFTVETDPAHAAWAEAFAAQLTPLGVRVSVRIMDHTQVLRRAATGESDACVVGWSGPGPDPLGLAVSKLTSRGAENFSGYASAEVDALLAGCITRPDEKEREKLAHTAQEFLYEEAPWVYGVSLPLYDAAAASLTGWTSGPAGAVSLHDAVLATGEERVTVGLGLGERPSLDPLAPIDPRAAVVHRSLFDALAVRGPDGNLLPELAESWEWSTNSRRLFVRLRDGVSFHNGEPLTAADVVFTYESILPGRLPTGLAAEVRAEGALDVIFSFSAPLPVFLDYFGLQPIVPAAYYRSAGPEGFSAAPVGTGPFRLDPEQAARHLVLQRWDGYYGGAAGLAPVGPASIGEILFSLVPDTDRRVKMLADGQLLLAPALPPAAAASLRGTDGLAVVRQAGLSAVVLELNNRRPPFDDTRVRLALNFAIDRPALVGVMGPEAALLPNAFFPEGFGFQKVGTAFEQDLSRARGLLTAAGYLVAEP